MPERALVDRGAGRRCARGVAISTVAPKRALELYDRSLNMAAASDPGASPAVATVHNRARALELIGRFAQAQSGYELALRLASPSRNATFYAFCLLGLASVAERSGDRVAAARYLAQVMELQGSFQSADNPVLMRRAVTQGRLDLTDGKLDEARGLFDSVLDRHEKNTVTILAGLGKAEVELVGSDAAAAVAAARTASGLAQSLQGTSE